MKITRIDLMPRFRLNKTGKRYVESIPIEKKDYVVSGHELVFVSTGIDDFAEQAVNSPHNFLSIPIIKQYSMSKQDPKKQTLSLENMEEFADTIIKMTANTFQGVGGPTQMAVFREGRVILKSAVSNLRVKDTAKFFLIQDNTCTGKHCSQMLRTPVPILYIGNSFERADISLDNNHYYNNSFRNCRLILRNDVFSFSSNNSVISSTLVLNKTIDTSNPYVMALENSFRWKSIERKWLLGSSEFNR